MVGKIFRYLRPSTARCMMWLASSIKERAFSLFGSCFDCSMSAWISGIKVPMSCDSVPAPRPSPAIPRAITSAEDNDLERCSGAVSERCCFCCCCCCNNDAFWMWCCCSGDCWCNCCCWWEVGSGANLTRGADCEIFYFKIFLKENSETKIDLFS